MRDRAEVIKGLEVCVSREPGGDYICYKCPYEIDGNDCEINSIKDAIALLKEQEAVEPIRIDGKRNHFIKCGNCNYDLMTGFQFCPHCGKAVKWE